MKIGLFASLVLHAQWQQLGGGGLHLVEGLEARELYDGASSNAIVEKKPGLRGVGQRELKVKTCSKEKRVQVYRFCIEGDCDAGADGEHRLKLDDHWLWEGFRDFREGQCHPINHSAKTVAAWKSLAVGTEERDGWPGENDSWFATMPASDWYSETCETYEVILAKQYEAQKKESVCWEMSAAGSAKGVDLGLKATRCSEWTKPSESFLWYLKVEPNDDDDNTYSPTMQPTQAQAEDGWSNWNYGNDDDLMHLWERR
eukprot:scaffold841_cov72-Skeletonema_dohrnii-CCMP3373.AAC.1